MSSCGADVITEVPASRWEADAHHAGDASVASRARHGGFMVGAQLFDGAVFGVSAAESASIDPQQRLLLEGGYAALHASGLGRAELSGSDTSVYVGMCSAVE